MIANRTAACAAVLALLLPLTAGCAGGNGTERERPAPSGRWTITVYYTAVESYHTGERRAVRGCTALDCSHGRADLGRYPADFVQAVKDEGTGRMTSGPHAGRYLNWSYDTGYWLDRVPRSSNGGRLRAYRSAAADPDVLRRGTEFTLTHCGTEDNAKQVDQAVCARLREASWTIDDEFTPGLGGERHLDLYLGEEDRAGFTESPAYATLHGATLHLAGSIPGQESRE